MVLCTRAASADDHLDAVVRATSVDDGELFKRIVGQVADIDVTLTKDETPLEGTFIVQLMSADALAREHHARVVLWFVQSTDGSGWLLCISEPKTNRVLVRVVGRGERTLTSAVLEQTALVARDALQALAAGGTIGVERAAYEPRPALPPPIVTLASKPSRLQVAAVGGLGAQVATDGAVANGAVALWLGARTRALELRLDGLLGVPTDTASPYATFHLTRDLLAVGASLNVARSRSLELDVGGRAGAFIYLLATRDPSALVTPSGHVSVSAAGIVGLEVRCRWRPTGAAWSIVLGGGVDVVLGAPSFGLTDGTSFVRVFTPLVAQPRALMGFELASRAF